jgi:hypothetical protein
MEQAVLRLAHEDAGGDAAAASGSIKRRAGEALDISTATTWPGIEPAAVLLQPHEMRTSWREFLSASNMFVQQVRLGYDNVQPRI